MLTMYGYAIYNFKKSFYVFCLIMILFFLFPALLVGSLAVHPLERIFSYIRI